GVVTASDIGVTTFSGQTVSSTDVLVKYTYSGDANLSGTVDFDDFNKFLAGFNHTQSPRWFTGDFNYTGTVDFDDFNKFLAGFNYFNAHPSEVLSPGERAQMETSELPAITDQSSPIPEPAILAPIAAAILLRR